MTTARPAARALDLAVDALAVARLTRLVTRDALTDGLRQRLTDHLTADLTDQQRQVHARRYGPDVATAGGPLVYLTHCPWCSSLWLAAGVTILRAIPSLPWQPIARTLALSYVAGAASNRD